MNPLIRLQKGVAKNFKDVYGCMQSLDKLRDSYRGTAHESYRWRFFRATHFLTKNAPKFSPKILSLY